ncbi:hypothetical protein EYB26_008961 [Talaromyces marneffei]|uniref:uncharacterized protein n=1 Tax=Talaromyces marneffei TaxID=37727 RepID=UPI0012A8F7FB|nr:uncharacterized protein EYB26_008961 [Talaromyces marneffei]QGA21251.1 hypothetical protein EYB26_008961 [Talaromyces marneffei]
MVHILDVIRAHRPRLRPRFLTIHYTYFIGMCMLTSVIFWGASTPARSVRYIDALFFAVSAMTETGLNTINLSTLNMFQQVILCFLSIVGSTIWVSIAIVLVRRRAFEKRFSDIVEEQRRPRNRKDSLSSRRPNSASIYRPFASHNLGLLRFRSFRTEPKGQPNTMQPDHDNRDPERNLATLAPLGAETVLKKENASHYGGQPEQEQGQHQDDTAPNHITFAANMRGQSPTAYQRHLNPPYENALSQAESQEESHNTEALDPRSHFLEMFGRNSSFHHLSEAERRRLGGVEYRAICLLSVIVPLYLFLWQFLGALAVGAYMARNHGDLSRQNRLNPWWIGIFFAISAFNNSGMSLIDANVVPFQNSRFFLITVGLLILAGNTCYPIFLRWCLVVIKKFTPNTDYFTQYHETVTFLLQHPRRCYTTLFPSTYTWWLLCLVIVLNCTDWVAFEVLNYDNPAIDSIPLGSRILDGLFQAICVRSGGFYVVSIASLQISLQVLYVVMMYIAVYPVVITMRNSNVYEERSLGIYADDPSANEGDHSQSSSSADSQNPLLRWVPRGRAYFVEHQLRLQLAHDLWWLGLAVIIISIIEAGNFTRDPLTYSVFNIIFETVSAYGCVGLSTGLPNEAYSFSGGWRTLSKLVLCAVMIRGRHRGLPVAIDKAILLPSEHMGKAEDEDANIRSERSLSRARRYM